MTGHGPAQGAPLVVRVAGIAAIGLLVFQLLRLHVAERYLIESGSMQPSLHGDPRSGDIVLVDKCGLLRSHDPQRLQRFDVVVVRNPDRGDPLIKRLGSLGDEELRIEGGDLFVRPIGGTEFTRVAKDPVAHRDLRQTFFEYPAASPQDLEAYLAPQPRGSGVNVAPLASDIVSALGKLTAADGAALPVLRNVRAFNLSSLNALGERHGHVECGVDDIGVELDFTLDANCDGVVFALDLRGLVIGLGYGRDGSLTFSPSPTVSPSLRAPALPECGTLACGYLDGRLFVTIDQALAVLVPWPLPDASSLRNGLRLAPVGSGSLRASRVRLFHDVHYRPEVAPFQKLRESVVGPGQVFLLGDNTSDSVDSRRRGAFPAADILGRPVAVIGPWGRWRWLQR